MIHIYDLGGATGLDHVTIVDWMWWFMPVHAPIPDLLLLCLTRCLQPGFVTVVAWSRPANFPALSNQVTA